MSDVSTNGAPVATRQYVQFVFYKVDPAWRRLPPETREAAKREVESRRQRVASVSSAGCTTPFFTTFSTSKIP